MLICASEMWTLTEKQRKKLRAIEIGLLRKTDNKNKMDNIRNDIQKLNEKAVNRKIGEEQ